MTDCPLETPGADCLDALLAVPSMQAHMMPHKKANDTSRCSSPEIHPGDTLECLVELLATRREEAVQLVHLKDLLQLGLQYLDIATRTCRHAGSVR